MYHRETGCEDGRITLRCIIRRQVVKVGGRWNYSGSYTMVGSGNSSTEPSASATVLLVISFIWIFVVSYLSF
jgi:hypothetical protein